MTILEMWVMMLAALLFIAALPGLLEMSLARVRKYVRQPYHDCPDCRDGDAELEISGVTYHVAPPRPRGFGRLPTPDARRYALEMIGERRADGEPFLIGDVPVIVARVRDCPPTFAGTPTRSLRVVYPDGAEEYFEFETTGQIIYRGEISE